MQASLGFGRGFVAFACAVALLGGCAVVLAFDGFDGEDYEEPAGICLRLQANPVDNVYGLSFEDGTWLINTPVFGQYFLSSYRHGKADSYFGAIGMIFRLMPHSDIAPYVGAGASYSRPWGGASSDESPQDDKPMAESYWGVHSEAGVRIWTSGRAHFFELFGGHTFNTSESRLSYWSVGLAYGQGW